jgi:hypothetical protein
MLMKAPRFDDGFLAISCVAPMALSVLPRPRAALDALLISSVAGRAGAAST